MAFMSQASHLHRKPAALSVRELLQLWQGSLSPEGLSWPPARTGTGSLSGREHDPRGSDSVGPGGAQAGVFKAPPPPAPCVHTESKADPVRAEGSKFHRCPGWLPSPSPASHRAPSGEHPARSASFHAPQSPCHTANVSVPLLCQGPCSSWVPLWLLLGPLVASWMSEGEPPGEPSLGIRERGKPRPPCLGSRLGCGRAGQPGSARQAVGTSQMSLHSCVAPLLCLAARAWPPASVLHPLSHADRQARQLSLLHKFRLCFAAVETTPRAPLGAAKPSKGPRSAAGWERTCHSRTPRQSHCKWTGLAPRLAPYTPFPVCSPFSGGGFGRPTSALPCPVPAGPQAPSQSKATLTCSS